MRMMVAAATISFSLALAFLGVGVQSAAARDFFGPCTKAAHPTISPVLASIDGLQMLRPQHGPTVCDHCECHCNNGSCALSCTDIQTPSMQCGQSACKCQSTFTTCHRPADCGFNMSDAHCFEP